MKFNDVVKNIPESITGNISIAEGEFIYDQIITYNFETCIEIGVASGYSSAIIIGALLENERKGKISNHTLYSYDLTTHCYWDELLKIGYAGREMLIEQHYNWVLRTQTTCIDLKKYHLENSVDFIFIDACHDHPWPAIDLYACLPFIKNNGIICLHDINLPTKNPQFKSDGVKTLFYNLDCVKFHVNEKIPNIGGIMIKNDKQYLQNQLKRIIRNNTWKMEVGEDILNEFSIKNAFA